MTNSRRGTTMPDSAEVLAQHNSQQRERAILALDRLFRERLASGMPGMIGIRIPFQRGKFGNIRELREEEI